MSGGGMAGVTVTVYLTARALLTLGAFQLQSDNGGYESISRIDWCSRAVLMRKTQARDTASAPSPARRK